MAFELCSPKLIDAVVGAKSGQEQKARRYMSDWMLRNSTAYREETIARVSDLFEETASSPYVLH